MCGVFRVLESAVVDWNDIDWPGEFLSTCAADKSQFVSHV